VGQRAEGLGPPAAGDLRADLGAGARRSTDPGQHVLPRRGAEAAGVDPVARHGVAGEADARHAPAGLVALGGRDAAGLARRGERRLGSGRRGALLPPDRQPGQPRAVQDRSGILAGDVPVDVVVEEPPRVEHHPRRPDEVRLDLAAKRRRPGAIAQVIGQGHLLHPFAPRAAPLDLAAVLAVGHELLAERPRPLRQGLVTRQLVPHAETDRVVHLHQRRPAERRARLLAKPRQIRLAEQDPRVLARGRGRLRAGNALAGRQSPGCRRPEDLRAPEPAREPPRVAPRPRRGQRHVVGCIPPRQHPAVSVDVHHQRQPQSARIFPARRHPPRMPAVGVLPREPPRPLPRVAAPLHVHDERRGVLPGRRIAEQRPVQPHLHVEAPLPRRNRPRRHRQQTRRHRRTHHASSPTVRHRALDPPACVATPASNPWGQTYTFYFLAPSRPGASPQR